MRESRQVLFSLIKKQKRLHLYPNSVTDKRYSDKQVMTRWGSAVLLVWIGTTVCVCVCVETSLLEVNINEYSPKKLGMWWLPRSIMFTCSSDVHPDICSGFKSILSVNICSWLLSRGTEAKSFFLLQVG